MNSNLLMVVSLAGCLAVACNLDKEPYDKVSSTSMSDTENAIVATTGNYALFKSPIPHRGYNSVGHTWIRHQQLLTEMKSDNVLMSGRTSDNLFDDAIMTDDDTHGNLENYWYLAYKIAYSTSAVINVIPPDAEDPVLLHVRGENLFMRALVHMNLCQCFAFPYALRTDRVKGPDELGVVIMTGPTDTYRRATVGEVYDQCEADLLEAIRCMDGGRRRGNNAFVSVNSARALLARLYLHEERNEECVALCDELLGSNPASHLDIDIEHLYQFTQGSTEVLWCVGLDYDALDFFGEQAMVGSMFNSQGDPGDGTGWAEIYWSQSLLDLIWRYPTDQRLKMLRSHGISTTGAKMIYWDYVCEDGYGENWIDREPVWNNAAGKWTCKDADGTVHTVETELVHTYPRNYIMLDGAKKYVTVTDSTGCRQGAGGNMYPLNYMLKFSNQSGIPSNLSSPAWLRYAEVILNRAEAEAKLGRNQEALDDVNIIRTRAGIPDEGMFTLSNYAERGYETVLDVVLDERRLELCFEGFRTLDLQRNNKILDRRYAGRHPYRTYKADNTFLRYFIPKAEITASGIPQNVRDYSD